MIRQIEEISMNAWPALQTLHYDGWVIRFADGLTKRSNSVNPIYDSKLDAVEKIKYCERLYNLKKLPACFKITEITRPAQLDSILEAHGYNHEFDISVRLMKIKTSATGFDKDAHMVEETDNQWIDNYLMMNEMDSSLKPVLKRILDQIILRKCLITCTLRGLPIGCGLGVIEGKFIGLFDIVIDRPYRNQGFGRAMVENILKWGKCNGAVKAYLQVLADNDAAMRLYDKVGFREEYRYWYRIKK